MKSEKAKVGIIGATGYTGEELLKLICRHPAATLTYATSESSAGEPLKHYFPWLNTHETQSFLSVAEAMEKTPDIVFTCLPAGKSATIAHALIKNGCRIIDLGADFRFRSPQKYKQWYQLQHPCPDLLQIAQYGLSEWNRKNIKTARIVANPGCYPTSILLALLPLLEANLLNKGMLFIDAKSGVTGAGKTPSATTHFCSANENLAAYKAGRVHRHVGEIERFLKTDKVLFTPHLIPMNRGLFSTMYVPVKAKIDRNNILKSLNRYKTEPFVNLIDRMPSTAMAAHTNDCFIHVGDCYNGYVQLFSAIDNLGKGASWQALQNMNIMLNLQEETGLQP